MRISDWSSDVCSSDLSDLDQPRADILGRARSRSRAAGLARQRARRASRRRADGRRRSGEPHVRDPAMAVEAAARSDGAVDSRSERRSATRPMKSDQRRLDSFESHGRTEEHMYELQYVMHTTT